MVTVKPEKEIIRKKINQLKLDRIRAKAKNKILSYLLVKIKEGLTLSQLEVIINKLIVSNVQYEERITTFLQMNYHLKGSFNSWDIQKERKKMYEEKKINNETKSAI